MEFWKLNEGGKWKLNSEVRKLELSNDGILKKYNLKIIKVWEVKVLKTRFLKMGAFEKLN